LSGWNKPTPNSNGRCDCAAALNEKMVKANAARTVRITLKVLKVIWSLWVVGRLMVGAYALLTQVDVLPA
jgi:hypothetical protein